MIEEKLCQWNWKKNRFCVKHVEKRAYVLGKNALEYFRVYIS